MNADIVNSWANWLLLASLIVGVISTYAIVVSGNIKERGLKRELAEANVGAEKAKRDAAKAEENITRVKAEADKQIALLNVDAEKAKSEIAKAQAQAAQANEKAESERLARVQLEARLADRKLTKEQQVRLVSLLEPFRDTEVDVVVLGDTSEIRLIGMTLLDCLHKAGWKVYQGYGSGGGVVVKGILVGVRSDSNLSGAANILVVGLRSMGIDTGLWDFEKLQYPSILMNTNLTHKAPMKIFIGSKP